MGNARLQKVKFLCQKVNPQQDQVKSLVTLHQIPIPHLKSILLNLVQIQVLMLRIESEKVIDQDQALDRKQIQEIANKKNLMLGKI